MVLGKRWCGRITVTMSLGTNTFEIFGTSLEVIYNYFHIIKVDIINMTESINPCFYKKQPVKMTCSKQFGILTISRSESPNYRFLYTVFEFKDPTQALP